MANPAFSNNPAFTNNQNRASQFGQQQYAQSPYAQAPTPTAEQLGSMYDAPAATPRETGRMSIDGTIVKTAVTLGVVALGFIATLAVYFMQLAIPFYVMTYGGALAGLVLGLVNVFKREPSRGLILAYAAAQGLFLGGLSATLEFGTGYDGIIFQALLATACVFGATLALYCFRIVRTSPKMNKIFLIVMIGYGLFSLVNVVLMLTGVATDPWGLRSATVFGIPLGVILGALAVLLGAYSLVQDFEMTENGVKRGAPRKYEWSAAFGITMTIIWLYVEILRILAILRQR